MKNISHTKEQVEGVFATALSIADAAKKLGLSGNNYRKVHFLAEYYNLPKPVYQASAINSAKAIKLPLEAILINGSHYNSNNLKRRLVNAGMMVYVCEHCALDPDTSVTWEGISLQLDHINGDSSDNRIENLRILCPNCHTQTETYGRGSGKKYKNGKEGRCTRCKRKSPHAEECWRCDDSKIEFPAIETIFLLLQTLTVSELADKLEISEQTLKTKMMGFASKIVDTFGDNKTISAKKQRLEVTIEHVEKKLPKPKTQYPPIPELLKEISQSSFVAVAERLGVSDNAVRKHIERVAGKDAVPRGYAKKPKTVPLTAGRQYLSDADVNDVIAEIEKPGNSIKSFAASIHVDAKYLRSWLEEKLGRAYIAPRNKQTLNPNQGKIVYPPVDEILVSIANNGSERTARSLGVTSKAVERHLRKHLPDTAFPLLRSGFLSSYRTLSI